MKKRKRERTIQQTIGLAVATSLGVGLVIGIIMLMMQYTNLRTLFDLLANNQSGETPKSELFLRLNYYRAIDEVIVTGLSVLIGGIMVGRFGSSKLDLPKTFAASAAASAIFLLIVLGFPWGVKLYEQQWKLGANQITPQFVEMQLAFVAAWMVVGLIGAWAGYIVKMKKASLESPTQVAPKTKQSVA